MYIYNYFNEYYFFIFNKKATKTSNMYYLRLGFKHIYIFDGNKINEENITDVINNKYYKKVAIYDYRYIITDPKSAYTLCYEINKNKYDWMFMNDVDEYLIIKTGSLRNYLSQRKFNICDFIKIHWVVPNDNNLLHYDNRSLLERFKGPYLRDTLKKIVRGKI